jgi:hypothetical protein
MSPHNAWSVRRCGETVGGGVGSVHSLRNRLVDAPDSWGARRRDRRREWLERVFPNIGSMSVIDLGGTIDAWLGVGVRPRSVHVVNLESVPSDVPPWIEAAEGDACALPAHIASRRYDLVFSNSVLEHVGGHARRQQFADSVHKLADRHWVQTPYRYFPVEPHWLFPGFQFLPVGARVGISRRWPLVHSPSKDREVALRAVLGVELVSRTEMIHYFPESEILADRFGGLVKSLIAVKAR